MSLTGSSLFNCVSFSIQRVLYSSLNVPFHLDCFYLMFYEIQMCYCVMRKIRSAEALAAIRLCL